MTTPADNNPTEVRYYHCNLDNYEPVPRRAASFAVEVFGDHPSLKICSGLFNPIEIFGSNAIFLLDDGYHVVPYYTVSYRISRRDILIQKFPVNYEWYPDSGYVAIPRDDNLRPVDFSSWQLGPRKCFHLKLTSVENLALERSKSLHPSNCH